MPNICYRVPETDEVKVQPFNGGAEAYGYGIAALNKGYVLLAVGHHPAEPKISIRAIESARRVRDQQLAAGLPVSDLPKLAA